MSGKFGYAYFVVCDNRRVSYEINKLREFLGKNPLFKRVGIYLHLAIFEIKDGDDTIVFKYIREDQVDATMTGQHDIPLIRPWEVINKLEELEVIK